MKKVLFLCIVILLVAGLAISLCGCYPTENQLSYEVTDDGVRIKGYEDLTSVDTLIIPDTIEGKKVIAIDNASVSNATSLKKLVIGANVKEIQQRAIINNTNLEVIEVSPENKHFIVVNGSLLTADGKELVLNPIKNGCKVVTNDKKEKSYIDEEYVVPEGVEIIRDYAFYHNNIQKVVMSDSVVSVGEASFLRVNHLKEVVFSKNLKIIKKDAFVKNANLTKIIIFDKIEEIQTNVFFDCENLLEINICAKEENLKLGKKWYPTKLGKEIKELVINFEYQI